MPCKGTKNKSPDELWTGKVPDYSALKVFGCTAFAHVPKQKRAKLDEKSVECTFVGYSDESKAYRLYCRSSKKIIISRDVNFIETELKSDGERDEDNTLYFDSQETCEPGGDDNDSHISDSHISETTTPDQESSRAVSPMTIPQTIQRTQREQG